MRINITTLLSLFALCCSACSGDVITVKYDGTKAEVSQVDPEDSVLIETKGAHVSIENLSSKNELTVRLSGSSDDGTFLLKTKTKASVELDNLKLQSKDGAPVWLKNKKTVELKALKGTENSLVVTACKDTANLKATAIWAKDKVTFCGSGKLTVLASGDGCKGINVKDDITIEDLTLDVKTTGDNLGVDTTRMMGFGGPGGMPGPPPDFNFDDLPDSVKQQFEEMRKKFEEGGMPGGPMGGPQGDMRGGPGMHGEHQDMHGEHQNMHGGPDMPGGPQGGMPGGPGNPDDRMGSPDMDSFPGGPGMGPGGKQKYLATCKGIKSKGKITINSGEVTVSTASRGAEGIEGKEGVIINGGTVYVDAMDDAINANAQIYFNGGKTTAISRGNDAVDANCGGMMGPPPFEAPHRPMGTSTEGEEGHPDGALPLGGAEKGSSAIIIDGGEIYAYSQVGAPEEGLDCDFSPIAVSGGKAFSIGAGMGDMPSCPTSETAKQPTALLIGLNLTKGKAVTIKNEAGKAILSITAPFSFRYSSSIITCPDFKLGETYTVESGEYKKTFTINENFTVVK